MNAVCVLIGVIGIMFGIICLLILRSKKQKLDIKTQANTIDSAEQSLSEVVDVQNQLQEIKNNESTPKKFSTITPGDSASRLERLNKLSSN